MAEEKKINLVLNRLSQSKYDQLKSSHQLCADQLYLVNDAKLDASDQVVQNVAEPVLDTDAANKYYVDQFLLDNCPDLNVRYSLKSLDWTLQTISVDSVQITANVVSAYDFAMNTVKISSDSNPYYIYLPKKASERARDFLIRVEVLSAFDTYPTLGFLGNNESVDFESEDDSWAEIEVGVNLFNFTETKAQET